MPLDFRYTDQPEGEITADQTPWYVRAGETAGSMLGFPRSTDPERDVKVLAALLGIASGLNYGRMGVDLLSNVAEANVAGRMGIQGAQGVAEHAALSRANPFFPPEMLANESGSQAWLRELHNQRIARTNMAMNRWGMAPIDMQGPNAELAPGKHPLFPSIRGNPGNARDVKDMMRYYLESGAPESNPYGGPLWYANPDPRYIPRIDPPTDPADWAALINYGRYSNPYLRYQP